MTNENHPPYGASPEGQGLENQIPDEIARGNADPALGTSGRNASEKRSYAHAKRGEGQNFQRRPLYETDRGAMCTSKKRYPSKRDAQTAVNSFSKKRGRHGRPDQLKMYNCPFCNGWHLAKKRK